MRLSWCLAAFSAAASALEENVSLPDVALGDPGSPDRWVVIHKDDLPSAKCSCQEPDISKLLHISEAQAATDLVFQKRTKKRHADFLPLDADDDDPQSWLDLARRPFHNILDGDDWDFHAPENTSVELKNLTIGVQGLNNVTTSVALYTEPVADEGSITLDTRETLRLVYVCHKVGESEIKLEYSLPDGQSMCFKWIKECDSMWTGFKVVETETGATLYENGQVSTQTLAITTSENAKAFSLMHAMSEGSTRILDLIVSSNSPKLKAAIKGGRDFLDEESDVLTLGREERRVISVIYTCNSDELVEAEVSLKIVNESPLSSPIELKWTASCSQPSNSKMHVTAQSCVASGSVKRRKFADLLLAPVDVLEENIVAPLFRDSLVFVKPVDDCTSFKLWTEDEVPLQLAPPPQLEYDNREMIISPRNGVIESNLYGDTIFRVSYACLREGAHPISLTLHVKSHPSMTIKWIKECKAPQIRRASVWTGDQILAGLMGGMIFCFLVLFFTRSRSLMRWIGNGVQGVYFRLVRRVPVGGEPVSPTV